MGETSSDHAVQAKQLRNLLGARVAVLSAKADLLGAQKGDREAEFFETEQRDFEIRHEETVELRDTYLNNFDGDVNEVTGDAKIFKE